MDPRVETLFSEGQRGWRPPPRLRLSEWADRHFYLSPESSAEPGRWTCLPYQREILDAITDPAIERVTVLKSARVGATKMLCAAVAFHMAHDPCPMMFVQPTVEDAQGFSKEEIAPMLRDVPALQGLVRDAGPRSGEDTILHKLFPGGSLTMVGANSGRGFRRVSRRIVFFDEVDAYPASAGSEGDQIDLGVRRTETFWNRKIVAASTPLVAGRSRISTMFEEGDQRRYHVPCPHCGHMAVLVFREDQDGHWMSWPRGKPEAAHFMCKACGCEIAHGCKREMIAAGRWVPGAETRGHASFHIWAAYSYSANATWGQIATEFVRASKAGPEKLRTCVNTVLGETWHERGEAPEWRRLYDRREDYPAATVPPGVAVVTAGVDVQRDRLVWEVVGWGGDRQSWGIEAGIFPGDPAKGEVWSRLDELLAHAWPAAGGDTAMIRLLAVDAGDQTQIVYSWARRYPMSRVIAVKGLGATAKTIIGAPTAVDVTIQGRRLARGYKVWPLGVSIAKGELYGWLRLEGPTLESGEPYPPGYCHYHQGYGEEYFRQLTAEQLVTVTKKNGFQVTEWQIIPGRENHWLDARVYARAAAALCGLDRAAAAHPSGAVPRSPAPAREEARREEAPRGEPLVRRGWLTGMAGARRGMDRGFWRK